MSMMALEELVKDSDSGPQPEIQIHLIEASHKNLYTIKKIPGDSSVVEVGRHTVRITILLSTSLANVFLLFLNTFSLPPSESLALF